MKVLIVTHGHGLMPFAWRLSREGVEVEVMVHRDRFNAAWAGRLPKFTRPEGVSDKDLTDTLRKALDTGAFDRILTDHQGWSKKLGPHRNLLGVMSAPQPEEAKVGFGDPVGAYVGGWFDGEEFQNRHLYVEEMGLWPGGMGPYRAACGTLVQPTRWTEELDGILTTHLDELKAREFRGLVQVDPLTGAMKAGWPFLHTHVYIAHLDSLSNQVVGSGSHIEPKYVMGLTVSVPPWPLRVNQNSTPHQLMIDPQLTKDIFFHDIQIVDGKVMVAGTDGLVGVVRGAANQLGLAKQRALSVARQIRGLQEPQIRTDAGQATEAFLIQAEATGTPV